MAESTPRRKLTDRQAAVLAAVERLGRPVMADLWREFPSLQPSAIRRVLNSLEAKGLVGHAGDDSLAYLNGVTWWSTALEPPDADPRLKAIAAALEQAKLDWTHSVDPHAGHVDLFVPLVELQSDLLGLPSEPLGRLREAMVRLASVGASCRCEIDTSITPDPEPRLALRLIPYAPFPGIGGASITEAERALAPETEEDILIIGDAVEAVLRVPVSDLVPNAAAANRFLDDWPGVWRTVGIVYMVFQGEDDEWFTCEPDVPGARRCWHLVDVSQPELWDSDGEPFPNPYHDPSAVPDDEPGE